MAINLFPKKNNVSSQQVKSATIKNVPVKNENQSKKSSFKTALQGAMFGAGIGIGDGIVSVYAQKNDIKKALEAFKNFSFADKKKTIQGLHNTGINVKQYKAFVKDVMNTSPLKVALKRALIYGGLATAVGYAIDLYKSHKDKIK